MYKIAIKICKICCSLKIAVKTSNEKQMNNIHYEKYINFMKNLKSNTNVCKRVPLLGFLYKFCTYLCGHVRGIGILNPKQHLTKNP